MDIDCRDYDDYSACLKDLSRVNAVTLTHRPMLHWLKQQTRNLESFSVLDVACGHGDALRRIRRWAESSGKKARLVGVDLNPWAMRAAREATAEPLDIAFHNADVFDFARDQKFDFIISSQFTHHLTDQEVVHFIGWMEQRAEKGWFVGDLHRHWFPYYSFPVLARALFFHHFVRTDGLISITRSFRPGEWRALLARAGVSGADVEWFVPFRLCVARSK